MHLHLKIANSLFQIPSEALHFPLHFSSECIESVLHLSCDAILNGLIYLRIQHLFELWEHSLDLPFQLLNSFFQVLS